jgi:hypothetical protein
VWRDVVEINGDKPTAKQARAVVQERQLKNPATEKQLAYLRKLGDAPPDRPVSKAWASKRIDELQGHIYCTCATCGTHYDRQKGRRL